MCFFAKTSALFERARLQLQMQSSNAYCKALKVYPSFALLLDVAFPQDSPWKSAVDILSAPQDKLMMTAAAISKARRWCEKEVT